MLDLLDVSRPALRLAAGLVGAVAGLLRFARRPPRAERGTGGAVDALVPVAVPLVAAPAVVVLGLSAGADLGVLFVFGCLALGVGILTATTAGAEEQGAVHRGRVGAAARHRGRPAACVLLVVDAVFAI